MQAIEQTIGDGEEFNGKLSFGVILGDAYRPRKGKGAMLPASRHVWADTGDALPDFVIDGQGQGQGQGWQWVSLATLDFLPVSVALASQYPAAGPLLREAQGQAALAMAKRQAAKLVNTMRRNGSHTSNATEGDASGDGALALVQWRNTYGPRCPEAPAMVCWRAVVASVAWSDMFGESIEDWRADDSGADCWDRLSASALPLPQLVGDGSRWERACRLRFERARASRLGRLARRMVGLKMQATGRRAQAVDKLHSAMIQLLYGASLDAAASAVGFKPSGQGRHAYKPGDALLKAARRMGYRVHFTARQSASEDTQARRGPFVPLSAATAAQWSFAPSAMLPLQNGRGDKQRVPLLRRLQRRNGRQATLQAKRQAWAVKLAKLEVKRATLARAQARQAAKSGLWAGALPVQPLPRRYGQGKLSDVRNRTWLKFGRGPMD